MEPELTYVLDPFSTPVAVSSEVSTDVSGQTSLYQPLSYTDIRGHLSSMEQIPIDSLVTGGADTSGQKKKKKHAPGRVAFHTKSAEDFLDDGYKWRKYGQKYVKNTLHPRRYYRCARHACPVKKQIQRLSKDTSVVVTTYQGTHNHPCEKLMETLRPLLQQLGFLCEF